MAAHETSAHDGLLRVGCKDVRLTSDQAAAGVYCRFPNGKRALAKVEHESQTLVCDAPKEFVAGDNVEHDLCTKDGVLFDSASTSCVDRSGTSASAAGKGRFEVEDRQAQAGPPGVIQGLSWTDRLLFVWILGAMVIGVVCGKFIPSLRDRFAVAELYGTPLPIAVGLWLMMWPVLSKVKYGLLREMFRDRNLWRQLALSVLLNWVLGPLIMTGLAWACLPDEQMARFRNGVILVGLARCIAMVLIWNQLARGDAEFCAILVAVNSVLQIILYSPLALFYLKVVSHQYDVPGIDFRTIAISVLIYLGAPLVAAVATRYALIAAAGERWYNRRFLPAFGPVALLALIYTVWVLFMMQGQQVVDNIGKVARVAVPMIAYFSILWSSTFVICRAAGMRYAHAVTQAFTASSNNFELAIAVAVGAFGFRSSEALAATVGPLIEVPVLLALVYVALWLQRIFKWE